MDLTPIFVLFILVGLPVMCGTLVALVKVIKGDSKKSSSGTTDEEEARIIQEIHRGLTRMEERIEALETLVFEREAARQSSQAPDR